MRCGWCGKDKRIVNEFPMTASCSNEKCVGYFQKVEDQNWEYLQRIVMRNRKIDFESGKQQGITDEYEPMQFKDYLALRWSE